MEFENIKTILIMVEFDNGNAHQVLATRSNKELALRFLATAEGSLKLTAEVEPITVTPLTH